MKKLILLTGICIATAACSPTGKLLREADTHYNNMEYHTAALQYSQYLKTRQDRKAEIRLAECYLRMNHFEQAEQAFAAVMSYPEITTHHKLQYAHTLKHNSKYGEAAKWYVEYLLENPNDVSATNELRSCDSVKSYNRLSFQYIMNDPGFNGTYSNFSPSFFMNGLVFCSERSLSTNPLEMSQWTGRPYLDLYYVPILTGDPPMADMNNAKGPNPGSVFGESKTRYGQPVPFAQEINSIYNEGPACFSRDEKTIYFTRNLLGKKNKAETTKEGVNHFEIYRAVLSGTTWSQPQLLEFESKEFSAGHPALSKDETRLYFVSDKTGGFGGTDIYFSDLKDGKWSEPVNAGSTINTNENEMFPVIHVDAKGNEILYYSTEGLPGLGGLDLYKVSVTDFTFGTPEHLNAPLNSAGDDFGIIFSPDGLSGYLSTNRDMSDGTDRILAFHKYIPEFFVDVTVYKKGTKEPIANASVDLSDITHNKKDAALTNKQGRIFRKIDQNSKLVVQVKKENFFMASGVINNISKVLSDTIRLTLELEPIVLNKPIRLDNIYYDYDKWNIRADATPSLDVLVKLMKENPGIHVELSSHTDSRGSDKYNMTLSQKRAQSAVDYIVSQGIDHVRIYAKGYGESKPLNKCKNKVKCTEEEFQLNRRTEFKVVKIINEVPPTPLNP